MEQHSETDKSSSISCIVVIRWSSLILVNATSFVKNYRDQYLWTYGKIKFSCIGVKKCTALFKKDADVFKKFTVIIFKKCAVLCKKYAVIFMKCAVLCKKCAVISKKCAVIFKECAVLCKKCTVMFKKSTVNLQGHRMSLHKECKLALLRMPPFVSFLYH